MVHHKTHYPYALGGMLAPSSDLASLPMISTRLLTRTRGLFLSVHTESFPRLRYMLGKGVYPSPLGYCGFPKSICTSVNNVGTAFSFDSFMRNFNLLYFHQVICHGIPDDRILLDGDVVKIDVSVYAALYLALHNAFFS
jgi:hypothetical protein